MGFYIINLFIILFYGLIIFLFCKNDNKNRKIFLILSTIHLTLIMAFRGISVGMDTKTYVDLFEKISYSDNIFTVIKSAPVYVVYNKAISLSFSNLQWILVFNAIIITGGIGIFIYRNSSNVVMSIYYYIALYFYFKSFNISRQFIAIVLVLNGYYFLKNNKNRNFFILLALATAVHNTAIVMILLYPLSKIKWSNLKILLLASSSIIFALLYEKILNIFLRFFPRYSMYVNGSSTFSIEDIGQGNKIFVSFFYLLIVILCLIVLKIKNNKNEEIKKELYLLTAIMSIASVVGIIFYNNLLISRIEVYFSIFIIIYIPLLVDYIGGRTRILLYYVFMIVTAIPMIIQLSHNISGVVPYVTFWSYR